MRTLLSLFACAAMLSCLAACNLPPANPNADHGAENLHMPTNSATAPAKSDGAAAQRAVNG
jgi:predicted small lipoprotein YifL